MPRKEPAKGIHTSPEKAGIKNMPENPQIDDENIMAQIVPIYNKGTENKKEYKGLWNEEDLEREIKAYLDYCITSKVKPAKIGLSLWLGVGKSQYYEWERMPEKYGYKSHLIRQANEAIELSYMSRIEKYPTGNIFLLKSSHDHIEASKLDITSNGKTVGNAEEVLELVSKLGLNK